MFSCWLTFHCELRPLDILNVLIWPSEQFEFEILGLSDAWMAEEECYSASNLDCEHSRACSVTKFLPAQLNKQSAFWYRFSVLRPH